MSLLFTQNGKRLVINDDGIVVRDTNPVMVWRCAQCGKARISAVAGLGTICRDCYRQNAEHRAPAIRKPWDWLTEPQGRALMFIIEYFRDNGMAPYQSEIAASMGLVTGCSSHIERLWIKGYIDKESGVKRSLRLTKKGKAYGRERAA